MNSHDFRKAGLRAGPAFFSYQMQLPIGCRSHLQLPSHGVSSGTPSVPIADYAFDCHTLKGKRKGKTKADFFRDEQRALDPFQPVLFDDSAGS